MLAVGLWVVEQTTHAATPIADLPRERISGHASMVLAAALIVLRIISDHYVDRFQASIRSIDSLVNEVQTLQADNRLLLWDEQS